MSFSHRNIASAQTGEGAIDEYPDISGITTARVRLLAFIIIKTRYFI